MRTLGFIFGFLILMGLTMACVVGYLNCALEIKYHFNDNTSSVPGRVALFQSYAFLAGAGICLLAILGLAAFGHKLFPKKKS